VEEILLPPSANRNPFAAIAAGTLMSFARLAMEPFGAGWAIKHNDGFLGYAKTEGEARALVESLAAYAASDSGSQADLTGDPA
jgi:hypothetical protein